MVSVAALLLVVMVAILVAAVPPLLLVLPLSGQLVPSSMAAFLLVHPPMPS
jgi:hypothetical protein